MAETPTLDDTPVVDAEPVEPEPAEPEPAAEFATSTEVVLRETEQWMEPAEDWPHQWLDYGGDHLAVRKPTQQALAAFSLASSRFVSIQTRNDITGLFIARHLSPESYARVFSRLMDQDDPFYTEDTVGELMKEIIELTTGAVSDNGKVR